MSKPTQERARTQELSMLQWESHQFWEELLAEEGKGAFNIGFQSKVNVRCSISLYRLEMYVT